MKSGYMLMGAMLVAGVVGFSQTAANAFPLSTSMRAIDNAAAFINGSRPVLGPFGHTVMCSRKPDLCTAPEKAYQEVALNTLNKALIEHVNLEINRTIRYRPDPIDMGIADRWRVAVTEGDCEDIALAKRQRLIELGFPAGAMRLAVGHVETGEGHAVLVLRTEGGDVILDNRRDDVVAWNDHDMRWSMIQSAENPRRWLAI